MRPQFDLISFERGIKLPPFKQSGMLIVVKISMLKTNLHLAMCGS